MAPSGFHHHNIILIGMPAVGKSTVGVVLAKRIGFGFCDTDLMIQTGEGVRLRTIIAESGLDRFCDVEARYIQLLNTQDTVIATGGSVIYRASAMAHLVKLGSIVFLDIQLPHLTQRLNELDDRGVVYLPSQTIDDLYAERRPLYQKYAHVTVDCTHCSPEQTVRKVLAVLGEQFKRRNT